jgi:hypothetical protein
MNENNYLTDENVIDEKLHEVKDDQQREKGAEIKIIIKFIF